MMLSTSGGPDGGLSSAAAHSAGSRYSGGEDTEAKRRNTLNFTPGTALKKHSKRSLASSSDMLGEWPLARHAKFKLTATVILDASRA
jgi:hypothetical protein